MGIILSTDWEDIYFSVDLSSFLLEENFKSNKYQNKYNKNNKNINYYNSQVKGLNRRSNKKSCSVWLFVFYTIIKDFLNLLIFFGEVAALLGKPRACHLKVRYCGEWKIYWVLKDNLT